MTKLLSSNFARLWKGKLFWGGLAVLFASSVLNVLSNWDYKSSMHFSSISFYGGFILKADHTLFPHPGILSLILAVLIGSFIGTEYGDKTIRNKIIAGHSRISIYFANLIVCAVAALIIYLTSMLVVGLGLGGVLLDGFELSIKAFILPVLSNLFATIALASLYLMVAMLIPNRTVSTVVGLLLALALMIVPTILTGMLDAPEYILDLGYVDEAGNYIESNTMAKNPAYLSGVARQICEFFYHLLPTGQLGSTDPFNPPQRIALFPLYSLMLTAISTGFGVLFFRRKDLK